MIGIESSNDTTKDLRQGPSTVRKGSQVIIKVVAVRTGIEQLLCRLGTVLVNLAVAFRLIIESSPKRPRHANNRGESGYKPHTHNTPLPYFNMSQMTHDSSSRDKHKHCCCLLFGETITITNNRLTATRGSLAPRPEGQTSFPDLAIVPIRDALLRVKQQQQQSLPFSCRLTWGSCWWWCS